MNRAPGPTLQAPRRLRYAIYTRKSSEEGLDMEFNSLDAQREACEAYIASQRSEGWAAIREPYDDGGVSGGTLDRPALQRLLADVEAGLIDVIVVYKIDRLSRSLMDFARLVEIFDRNQVTLRDECGMGVVLIAHAEIRRFDSPETEPYDRYQPKLHKSASALVQEHVDAVLFANYRISTLKSDVGFNKKVVRGVGGGDRLLHTIERPAFLAKNRFGLEETLPLAWADLAAGIPFYAAAPSTPVIPTQDTGN